MKALATLSSRALVARTMLMRQAIRRHGHDVPVNPGPPVTLDYHPVPQIPYKTVHAELQTKFNTYLAISLTLLAVSIGSALYTDLWILEALRPPLSWRNRNKSSA